MRQLRLLEVGVDIELIGRHQSGKAPAGRHQVAGLHRQIAHHPVIGGAEHSEAQIALGLVAGEPQRLERAFGFRALPLQHRYTGVRRGDLRVAGHDLGVGLVECRIGRIEAGLRSVGRGDQRRGALLRQRHVLLHRHQRQLVGIGLRQRRLRPDDLRVDPLQRQVLRVDLRQRLVAGDLVIAVVERDQRVALLDRLVGRDVDLGDVAGKLGGNRRDVAFDISVVGRHHEPAGREVFGAVPGACGKRHEPDAGEDQRTARAVLGDRLRSGIVGGSDWGSRRSGFVANRNRGIIDRSNGLNRQTANILGRGLSHRLAPGRPLIELNRSVRLT